MKKNPPVTVVMTMKNAASTVGKALESLTKQTYPIREIIVVDNISSDRSVEIVTQFARKNRVPITLVARKKNYGVAANFNYGTYRAKTELVVLMHSDSYIPTKAELKKLVNPLLMDTSIVATGPILLHPYDIWETYSFWQKYLFARVVGTEISSGNGKFDCVRKTIFTKIGGLDDRNYSEEVGTGGEDGDLHIRMRKEGKIILSEARVIHLHYLNDDYSITDVLRNRRILASSYGALLRIQGARVGVGGLVFLIKPILSIAFLIPVYGLIISILYSFWYTKNMFTKQSTLQNYRILFVPIFNILLVYYETYYMVRYYLKF